MNITKEQVQAIQQDNAGVDTRIYFTECWGEFNRQQQEMIVEQCEGY